MKCAHVYGDEAARYFLLDSTITCLLRSLVLFLTLLVSMRPKIRHTPNKFDAQNIKDTSDNPSVDMLLVHV